jgi:hypothetical protein
MKDKFQPFSIVGVVVDGRQHEQYAASLALLVAYLAPVTCTFGGISRVWILPATACAPIVTQALNALLDRSVAEVSLHMMSSEADVTSFLATNATHYPAWRVDVGFSEPVACATCAGVVKGALS